MKYLITKFILLVASTGLVCAQEKGLKDYYERYFPIGVAVSPNSIRGEEAAFILRHFNSITPENAMKMGPIHPAKDRYNWRDADSIVNFGLKNNLKIRGHALLWHEQTPNWIFKNDDGSEVSKDSLLLRLKLHIETVVGRYKGKIYAWDVVNEAVDDNPQNLIRKSDWYRIAGEEIIGKAFEYAHAVDPEAILYYNDYNTEIPHKRDRIYTLVKKLKDAGIPVHGVGLQGHWSIYEPDAKELQEALSKFESLDLDLQITEMDMSVYPWEKERRPLRVGEQLLYNDELADKQAAKYAEMFAILRNQKAMTGVTFWNLSDRYSWLDYYPVSGRKNFPLLFDVNLKPKKAFWKVVDF